MDYNDNEFESQNAQLVGEDSSKFSPGIRSYALPKFDLDDHLQVHLRFDSLVETEILLGIQNQEDNWIENYSGESTGVLVLDPISQSIESESCSISRRNNVWSEATSSESVEMLLNSVGQDEIIEKQSSVKEHDACDVPINNLDSQMDPNLSQDDPVPPKIGNALDVDPMQRPTDFLKSSSGVTENAAGDLSLVEDLPETHEVGTTTVFESSNGEKCGIFDHFTAIHSGLDCNIGSFQDATVESSVGQDEIIEKQSSVKEFDACDVPINNLDSQMDPHLSHDDPVPPKIGNALDVDPMQQPPDCLKSPSGITENAVGDLSLVEDLPETYEVGTTVHKSSNDEKSGIFDHFTAIHSGLNNNIVSFQDASAENLLMSGGYNKEMEMQDVDPELQKDNLVIEVSLGDKFLEKDACDGNCSAAIGSMQGGDSSATLLHNVVQITEDSCEVLREDKLEGLSEDKNLLMNEKSKEEMKIQDVGPDLQRDNLVMEVSLGDRFLGKDAGDGNCSAAIGIGSMRDDDSSATLLHNVVQITEDSSQVLHEDKLEGLLEDANLLIIRNYKKEMEMQDVGPDLQKNNLVMEVSLGSRFLEKDTVDSNCSAEIKSMQSDKSSVALLHNIVQTTEESSEVLHGEKPVGLLEDGNHQMGSEISGTNTSTDDHFVECTLEKPFVEEESQTLKGQPDETHHDNTGNPSGSAADMDTPPNITHEMKELHVQDGLISLKTNAEDSNVIDMDPLTLQKTMRDKIENDIGDPDVILNDQVEIVLEQGSGLRDSSGTCDKSSPRLGSVIETTAASQEMLVNKDGLVVTEKPVVETQNSQSTEAGSSLLTVKSGSAVGEVSGDITDSTPFNNPEVVRCVLPENNPVSDEAIEQKEVEVPHSPAALSDKKKELVNGDSLEPSSLALQDNIHCLEGNGAHTDAVQGTYDNSATELPTEMVTCSLASAEKPELEGSAVDHEVTCKDDCSEVPKGYEKFEAISLHATEKSELEGRAVDHEVIGEDHCSEVPKASSEKYEATSLHATDCGAPIIISCSEHSQSKLEQQEGSKKFLDQNGPVSVDLPQDSSHADGKIDKFESASHDRRNDGVSENDKKFTFEVGSLASKGTNVIENMPSSLVTKTNGNGLKSFPDIQPTELPQSGERSPIAHTLHEINQKVLEENPQGSHQLSDELTVQSASEDPSADKSRSVSGSTNNKGAVVEGQIAKEISCTKQKEATLLEDGNLCSASAGSGDTPLSRTMQLEVKRPCPAAPVQASSLPDLNTSASPASTLFQQPFTDLQQIQLRAQIFVYGSLIQGAVPDEACMASAFGETGWDRGRSVWENVWRIAAERPHNQKSPLNNPETPIHSRSGVRNPEQASRCGPLQIKTSSTPTGRIGMKSVPPSILNTSISLSTPVWSMSTPSREAVLACGMGKGPLLDSHQAISPLHLYQSPQIRHYLGPNNAWPSPQSCPVPWIVSPQTSAFGAGPQYSTLPTSETVQVTPVRDHPGVPPIPRPTSMQLGPSSPLPPSLGSVTDRLSIGAPVEVKRTAATPGRKSSIEQKPRKRKKGLVLEAGSPSHSVPQPQTESPSATNANNSSPLTVFTPSSTPRVTTCATSSAITAPTHYQIISGGNSEQRVTLSEETCSRIQQAKLHAEDAAALAISAVQHSQGIWSQLDAQKNSGLLSDVEAKLASAAVAASAAASVAKAAAAAAKVAYNASLQSKLISDEALSLNKIKNSSQSAEIGFLEGRKISGKVMPSSILKGKDKKNGASSVIGAAREAVRKRVESASAAAKRAENLDAVVKAAELAAEAVSQAGAIIGMGDPIPLTLSELVEAGPEGFWKARQANNNQMGEPLKVGKTVDGEFSSATELSRQFVESQKELANGMHAEKRLGWQKGRQATDLSRTIGVVPESEIGSKGFSANVQNDEYEKDRQVGPSKENTIVEGSLVEVVSDEKGFRGVWFSAKVLSLKDGKAFVCFNELLSDEGRGQLKEWVPLEGEGDKPPRIRIAHPMTAMKFEGTRKRRRAAVGNHVWSVGDRVDAWIRDGWWEGIITEKNKDDETKFMVNFLAEGDPVAVNAWNLRPSLIWKNDQWIECSSSGERNHGHYEGDTPQDKRQKLGNVEMISQVDAKGRGKLSKDLHFQNSKKPEGPASLALSMKEIMFNAGKNLREENSAASRVKRTGLQKEGSKVVFGVPKPGKKKKFMDVSKHYITDNSENVKERNDSVKLTQYLMPQSSRGLRNAPKVDSKRKRPADSKPKELKSGKSYSIQSKNKSDKESSSITLLSASDEANGGDPLPSTKASAGHEENKLEKQSTLEAGCFSNSLKPAQGPVLNSSSDLVPDVQPPRKKSHTAVNSEQGMKGKLARADGKRVSDVEKASITIDIPVKPISNAIEPRRSNRRIQPTSRLLEGLQSSPVIPKAPVSHDNASGTQNKISSLKGNNHG